MSIALVIGGSIVRLHPEHLADSFLSWFLFFEIAIINYHELKSKTKDRFYILGASSAVLIGWTLYFHFSILGLQL
jgi:hypothetical protein